jgi:hypothetical protein
MRRVRLHVVCFVVERRSGERRLFRRRLERNDVRYDRGVGASLVTMTVLMHTNAYKLWIRLCFMEMIYPLFHRLN